MASFTVADIALVNTTAELTGSQLDDIFFIDEDFVKAPALDGSLDGGDGTDRLILLAGASLAAVDIDSVERLEVRDGRIEADQLAAVPLIQLDSAFDPRLEIIVEPGDLVTFETVEVARDSDLWMIPAWIIAVPAAPGSDEIDGRLTLDFSSATVLGRGGVQADANARNLTVIGTSADDDFSGPSADVLDTVSITGGGGADGIFVASEDPTDFVFVDGGAGRDEILLWTPTEFGGLAVTGGGEDDRIEVIGGSLSTGVIDGGDGFDTLEISDAFNNFETSLGRVTFQNIEQTILTSKFTEITFDQIPSLGEITINETRDFRGDPVILLNLDGQVDPTLEFSNIWLRSREELDFIFTADYTGTLTLDFSRAEFELFSGLSLSIPAGPVAGDITGGAGDDFLAGGEQNDTIRGGDEFDFVRGGDGADLLEGGDGSDTLVGDPGNDTIRGGDGDDYIDDPGFGFSDEGSPGDDVISGGAGDDDIFIGAGSDVIDGGSGVDQAFVNGARADFELTMAGATVTLTDLFALDGDSGTKTLTRIEEIVFSDGAVALALDPTDAPDDLFGTAGDDDIAALAGDDFLNASPGRDALDGGPGADTALFDDAAGGLRIATLAAWTAAARALAPQARGGDDQADQLLVATPLDAPLSPFALARAGRGDIARSYLDGLPGTGDVTVLTGIAAIEGSGFGDVFEGRSEANQFDGGGGADLLDGGAAADTVVGGDGPDRLAGGANDRADDLLYGGSIPSGVFAAFAGRDTAADVFVYEGAGGVDRLADFRPGIDSLNLDGTVYSSTAEFDALIDLLNAGPRSRAGPASPTEFPGATAADLLLVLSEDPGGLVNAVLISDYFG
ncbi:MAG: calcium-binding protein [Pikeienuella sp.]